MSSYDASLEKEIETGLIDIKTDLVIEATEASSLLQSYTYSSQPKYFVRQWHSRFCNTEFRR
eukprot:scaffold9508_cov169-Skeletonema_menzelii.AAC.6